MENDDIIKVGDHVVVQRQGYTKLHKVKKHGNLALGSFIIEMDNIVGERYFTSFQMKNTPGSKRNYILEKAEELSNVSNTLNIEKSGNDNRNIIVDGDIQNLKKEDIDKLKEAELSSNNIVGELINNSKTFNLKTGYSQEKYIKKKEKKYFEYILIRRPTIRLLSQMFYRQDTSKTLGIRCDDLSQILTYSNIHPEGNHLLYDSGTSGLISAAIMSTIGADTEGFLVHMHPGNECQKNAFVAMQFPKEQNDRCVNVNLYSVLRCFYQNKESFSENDEPETKKMKIEENKKSWMIENEKACKILEKKVDSLIITAKEHPVNIVRELLQFLNTGRSLVVFSLLKEPLQDLYVYLKGRSDIISIKLSTNFMRNYQILPERTHPEVMMNSGGYILTGYKIDT